jgi:hypothetical protein
MKVKLMVDWRGKEILTVKELDERINARVEEAMQDAELYEDYLDDYIDCNYTKKELFDALSGSEADREEVLDDIRSGVAEEIYDFVNMDISSDFSEVIVEV